MDSNNIEDLAHHFVNKLAILSSAVSLSNATVDQNYIAVQDSLFELLDRMKLALRGLSREVDSAKTELQHLEEMKMKCLELAQHVQFVVARIPSKLPTNLVSRTCPQDKQVATDHGGMGHQFKPEVHQAARGCSYLDFLTVNEFETVPKYMKGRLTYEKVNTIIEHLDQVFTEKYKILKMKSVSLNDLNRKRVEAFRSQENKDTEGSRFITEKDITDLSSLKVDNCVRNVVTILRHFNILHEIRSGGFVRFAVTTRY